MVSKVRFSNVYRVAVMLFTLLSLTSYAIIAVIKFNSLLIVASICVGISYGLISNVVAARRLYFLAAASSHSALFAASLGMSIYLILGGNPRYWSLLVGIVLLNLVAYLIRVSRNRDVATSVFVSLTSSLGVITLYYLSQIARISKRDLMSIIVGELTSISSTYVLEAILITLVLVTAVIATYYGLIYESISDGISKYDVILYVILALVTVGLIKLTGCILEHVLILMPGAIASMTSRRAKDSLVISTISSITATSIGLLSSVISGLSPSGVAGVFLVGTYVLIMLIKKVR